MGNENWQKYGDVLQLGSKAKYGSFHFRIYNLWVEVKLHDHQSPLCNYLEGFTFYFCFTSLPSTCQSQARCSTKNAGAWSR